MIHDSRLRAAKIEVHIDCSAKSTVRGLRGEMHQVLPNLISNSIDAMPQPGTISISIEDSSLEGKPGVNITVADTGKGIPSENLSRLFEPFFTTKPDAGTGLGLWVVKQYVDSWSGRISVESSTDKDNHGTTFSLFVPVVALSKTRNKNIQARQPLPHRAASPQRTASP